MITTKLKQSSTVVVIVALVLLAACKGGAPRTLSSESVVVGDAAAPAPPFVEPETPTYWNRIAGILETHCTKCHAPSGIGPMPLVSYEDAKSHAAAIAYETQTHHMPPWLPNSVACASLRHSRALADADIRAIQKWTQLGAQEGKREDYRAPVVTRTYGSLPPNPNRTARPEEPYAPKRNRADDYHCFVLDPKITSPERIVGLRITPGLPNIVHHVLLFEVRPRALAQIKELDDAEPGPGYTCFGGIGVSPVVRAGDIVKGELVDFDAQMIVGWAPGAGATDVAGAPTALPEGTAIKLAPGSKLVMQVHYSLASYEKTEPGAKDQTSVEMWMAKNEDVLRQAVWIPLLKYDFRVPKDAGPGPDDPRATAKMEMALPFPLEVRGVAPHMHLRGKSIHVEAIGSAASLDPNFPKTETDPPPQNQCLLDVPRWDFHHQEGYWLEKGVRVSKASVTCNWDNRTSTQPVVNGKRKPSRDLRWGEGTDDEMCLAFLYATL